MLLSYCTRSTTVRDRRLLLVTTSSTAAQCLLVALLGSCPPRRCQSFGGLIQYRTVSYLPLLEYITVQYSTRLSNRIWYCAPGALAVLLIDDSKIQMKNI